MSEFQLLQFLQELGEGFTTPPPPVRPVILRQQEARTQLDSTRQADEEEQEQEQEQEQEALLGSARQTEGAQPDSASSEAASPPTATARSELALPHWAAECLGNKTVDKIKAMAADPDADVLTKTKNILSTLPDLAALALPPRFAAETAAAMGSGDNRNSNTCAIGMLTAPCVAAVRVSRVAGIDLRSAEVKQREARLAEQYGREYAASMAEREKARTDVLARLDCLELKVLREAGEQAEDGESEEDVPMCAICQVDFKQGEQGFAITKCSHKFHVKCLNLWLHRSDTCPCCRAQLVAKSSSSAQPRAFPFGHADFPSATREEGQNPAQQPEHGQAGDAAIREAVARSQLHLRLIEASRRSAPSAEGLEFDASSPQLLGQNDPERLGGRRPPTVMSVSRDSEPHHIAQMVGSMREQAPNVLELAADETMAAVSATANLMRHSSQDFQELERSKGRLEELDIRHLEHAPVSGSSEQLVLMWNAGLDDAAAV